MKSGLFLLLIASILCPSCQWDKGNVTPDGFVTLQPGYFCQLEAIAVVGDTIVLAGSYIPEENPNIPVQPVYSYLAAVSKGGKVYWEQTPEEADYVKWGFLVKDSAGVLYSVGMQESPIGGKILKILEIDVSNGMVFQFLNYPETERNTTLETVVRKANGQLLLLKTNKKDSITEMWLQVVSKETEAVLKLDSQGNDFQMIRPLYFPFNQVAVYGTETYSTGMVFYGNNNSSIITPLPSEFNYSLINDLVVEIPAAKNVRTEETENDYFLDTTSIYPPPIYLVTTTKNAQGPCLWRSGTDSTWQHTCLDYWPFHGTAILRQHGTYTLMAFNAGDTDKPSTANVVLFDEALQVVWQQDISPKAEAFIIKDMAVQQNNVVVGGTLETEGKGSRMAVKIIALPPLQNQKIN